MTRRKSSPKKKPTNTASYNFRIGSKSFKVRKTLLKEIRKLQQSTEFCIPKLPFSRVIREVLQQYDENTRIQLAALQALQESAELYLVQLFEDANKCAYHAKRVTVKPTDMKLVLELRGCSDPGYNP